MRMLDEITVQCPYCGAHFVTVVDCSEGNAAYVEDCQVCCAPINFHVQVDEKYELLGFELRRDDE